MITISDTLPMLQSPLAVINKHVFLTSFVILLVTGILLQVAKYYRHPLRHIPGSIFARTSRAPLFYQSLRGTRVHWIREQHARYGPVIRITPNKVCVASDEGIKQIYSNKAEKSHMYDAFKYQDVKMCLGLLDVKSAHVRRKGLLPAFSRQNLMKMEPVIRLHLERFLEWVKKFDQMNQTIDVFKWYRYLTFDVVTDIAFGQQIGMLASEDTHFITQIEYRNIRNGLIGPFPFILPVLRFFRTKTAEKWLRADAEIAEYAIRARRGWRAAEKADRPRVDILARLEDAAKDNPKDALSDKEIIATMMEILNAGSDTTANTAMFTTYELARHPAIQDRLHQELCARFPDPNEPLSFEELEKLPFLDGVCKEGLRLHAPIPCFLERIAPEPGLDICGYSIPAGTIIGMQGYTNHRDSLVYPAPESFAPERWFEATAAMKLNFLPFSSGPRACIGLNLANMQLRIHLGHIFRRFEVSCAPETTPLTMEHLEFFTVRPRGGKCDLYFRERDIIDRNSQSQDGSPT